jgi:hypothetical protein
MNCARPDSELLRQLLDIPEVGLCSFKAREGLAGTGVTMLKGQDYFGSWRTAPGGDLVWTSADLSQTERAFSSVDEAVRYTLLLILRDIQVTLDAPRRQTRTA